MSPIYWYHFANRKIYRNWKWKKFKLAYSYDAWFKDSHKFFHFNNWIDSNLTILIILIIILAKYLILQLTSIYIKWFYISLKKLTIFRLSDQKYSRKKKNYAKHWKFQLKHHFQLIRTYQRNQRYDGYFNKKNNQNSYKIFYRVRIY